MSIMKVKMLLLMFVNVLAISISAQDYYYFQGNKVEIYKDLADVRGSSAKTMNSIEAYNASDVAHYISSNGDEMVADGYINVRLHTGTDYVKLETMARQYECEIVSQNSFMPLWYVLRAENPEKDVVEIANSIFETGMFASSSPSFVLEQELCEYLYTYDPLWMHYGEDQSTKEQKLVSDMWNLYNTNEGSDISINEAWNYSSGCGVKIAIIDSGVDMTHPDLKNNIYPLSYDAETGTSPSQMWYDNGVPISHGTHCAGIAAASANNDEGIVGVAPDAMLMCISNGVGTSNSSAKYADAVNWAWMNTNYPGLEPYGVEAQFDWVSPFKVEYPASRNDVIAVGNITISGIRYGGSRHGETLDILAPGTDVLSCVPNGKYEKSTGTSVACPHVSGVAALMLARNPQLTASQVKEILCTTAKKVGDKGYLIEREFGTHNDYYGYGMVDAYQAVINTPRH